MGEKSKTRAKTAILMDFLDRYGTGALQSFLVDQVGQKKLDTIDDSQLDTVILEMERLRERRERETHSL